MPGHTPGKACARASAPSYAKSQPMPKPDPLWKKLRDHALSKPEAYEDFPWGDRVAKVGKKIFVFLGDGEGPKNRIGVKLLESHEDALSVPGSEPVGYGLGRAGWVTVPIGTKAAREQLLVEWIDESYRLVAPKRLTKTPAAKAREPLAGKATRD